MNNSDRTSRPWIVRLAGSPRALIAFAVLAVFGLIIGIAGIRSVIGWNPQGKMVTGIYLTGGTFFVDKPGYYFKWFANQEEIWPKVATLSIGSYEGGKDDIKDNDIERVPVSFRGSAKADQSVLARFTLPQTKAEMFKIWNDFPGGYANFMRKGLVPEVQTAIRTSANLLDPEEALNNVSLYKDKISDQLQFGSYITYSKIEEDSAEDGSIERKSVTKVQEKDGQALRKALAFSKYGVSFLQVEVSLPVFDKSVADAINERRQQTLNAETSKKKRIAAEQDLLAKKAEGEAAVVAAQFRIQQEQAETVAKAKLQLEASQLDVQSAENQKKAEILRAEGEAAAKKMVMQADGYMEKILKAEIQKTELLADAIKNSQVSWVPEIVINGNGSSANGVNALQNMAEFLTIQSARDLQKQLKDKAK